MNDINSPLEWVLSGANPTIAEVIYPDHTSGLGSFAVLTLAVGNINDKGRLISQNYKPSGPECLQFWYYSNRVEASFATLNILKLSQNIYSNPLWSANNFETNDWQFGQVQVGDDRAEFSFIFEGVKNENSNNAFIGIDDVTLKIGACPPPVNCNFEDATICSWSQYNYDDLDWLPTKGRKGN